MIPRRVLCCLSVVFVALGVAGRVEAQLPLEPAAGPSTANALSDPSMTPGTAFLFELEAKFAKDTAAGGGKAFSAWFAENAVSLSNGQAPVTGHDAIAKGATWAAADYQLTWTPTAGQMAAAGDMGFTWGHYEGRSKDTGGHPVVVTGRYMTIWKKQADGSWKVELDSSNDEPVESGDCCKVP
jgi:ketosteroid isomerase-like protein